MSTKCQLSEFSPLVWDLSVMVVTQDRKDSVLHGVTGYQSQLRVGHCCICTASWKACPPLVWVVPATVVAITCNSNPGLQKFNGIFPSQSPPLVPLK